MAAPTTPSRRVLGRLDHNTALLSSTAKTFKSPGKQPALSPRKVAHGVDDAHGVIFATRRSPEVPRSGLKRKLDFVYVDPDVLEGEKRVRIAGEMEPVGSDEERIINAAGEGMDALDDLRVCFFCSAPLYFCREDRCCCVTRRQRGYFLLGA